MTKNQNSTAEAGANSNGMLFFLLVTSLVLVPCISIPVASSAFLLPQQLLWQLMTALAVLLAAIQLARSRVLSAPELMLWAGPVIFMLALMPSVVFSTRRDVSAYGLIPYAAGLITFLGARLVCNSQARTRIAFAAIALVAVLQSAYALCQYVGFDPLFHATAMSVKRLGVFGFMGNPNFLAAYLSGVLPVILVFTIAERRPIRRFVAIAAACLTGIGITVSGSKGGIISGLAGIVFLAGSVALTTTRREHASRTLRPIIISAVAIVSAVVLFLVLTAGTFPVWQTMTDSLSAHSMSVGGRIIMWKSTLTMFASKPLYGFGIGTFAAHYLDFRADILAQPAWSTIARVAPNPIHPHNDYLQLLVETGIFGFAGFCGMLIVLGRRSLLHIKQSRSIWAAGAAAGVFAVLVQATVCFPLHRASTGLLFWFLMAISQPPPISPIRQIRLSRFAACMAPAAAAIAIVWLSANAYRLIRAEMNLLTGLRLIERQEYPAAIASLRSGLANDPRHGGLWRELGRSYFLNGSMAEAVTAFNRSKDYLREPWVHLFLADAYDELGMSPEADAEYRNAIRLKPFYSKAFNNYAVFLHHAGRTSEAILQWERAVESDPNAASAILNLGIVRHACGEHKIAAALAKRALALPFITDTERRQAYTLLSRATAEDATH